MQISIAAFFLTILIAVGFPGRIQAQESGPPKISFNTANKETAGKIYQLIKEIQDTEFSPEENLAAISRLQDATSQTEFGGIPRLADYIKDSLSLNSLRTKDLKVDIGKTGQKETLDVKRTMIKGNVSYHDASFGGDLERSASKKNNDNSTSGVSISSQNEVAILDKIRQQQAASYGRLLIELKRIGFPRPITVREIVGKWKWRCREDAVTYEFDFKPDGVVLVKLNPDSFVRLMARGFVNSGRGEWSLDYRSLSVKMNDVNLAGFWKQSPLLFFTDREIVSLDDEKMLLAISEDNELKRIRGGSRD